MKKMKKALAVILSLAMVLGMSMTTFAEGESQQVKRPAPTDNESVVIRGLNSGDAVKLYKIVDTDFTEGDNPVFKNYVKVPINGNEVDDIYNPSAGSITAIAKAITATTPVAYSGRTAVLGADGKAVITIENVLVGSYLVLVESAGATTVYNPMVASVYYTTGDDFVKSGDLNAGGMFGINPADVYAKKSDVTIEKEITNFGTNGNKKGDDLAIGDTAQFKITTDIPSYSDEYEKVVYRITDTLDGLNKLSNLKVYLNEVNDANLIPSGKYTITDLEQKNPITIPATAPEGNVAGITSFSINFDSSYIMGLSGKLGQKVVVTYDAVLSDESMLNYDPHTNTAHLIYTNKPGTDASGDPYTNDEEKKTYHYTFAIDAEIGGDENWITTELIKTGEEFVTGTGGAKKPLPGAKFTLTNKGTKKVYEATSTNTGAISFKGLDSGMYTLVETEAPAGYSRNEAEIPVVIGASYNDDGTLKEYHITVGSETVGGSGVKTTTYTMDNNKKVTTTVTTKDKDGKVTENEFPRINIEANDIKDVEHDASNTYEIENTKLASLPSTGGIGTTIFTIGGCAIMIVAAALFFASRRKSVK